MSKFRVYVGVYIFTIFLVLLTLAILASITGREYGDWLYISLGITLGLTVGLARQYFIHLRNLKQHIEFGKPYVDIYRSMGGWKACHYTPYGPEVVGPSRATPWAAYRDAKHAGVELGCPVTYHWDFGKCRVHGREVVDGKCEACAQDKRTAEWKARFDR